MNSKLSSHCPLVSVLMSLLSIFCMTSLQAGDIKNNIPDDIQQIVFAQRSVPADGHWYANIGYAAPGPEVKRYGAIWGAFAVF